MEYYFFSNAIAGETSLDRLANSLGGKAILPHIISNIPSMMQSGKLVIGYSGGCLYPSVVLSGWCMGSSPFSGALWVVYGVFTLQWCSLGSVWGLHPSVVLSGWCMWSPPFSGTLWVVYGVFTLQWCSLGGVWGLHSSVGLSGWCMGSPPFSGALCVVYGVSTLQWYSLGGVWGLHSSVVLSEWCMGSPPFSEVLTSLGDVCPSYSIYLWHSDHTPFCNPTLLCRGLALSPCSTHGNLCHWRGVWQTDAAHFGRSGDGSLAILS